MMEAIGQVEGIANTMKCKIAFFLPIIVFNSIVYSQNSQLPIGVVASSKAAFQITAPKNWVLDDTSGLSSGLPCVLYLSGFTRENSSATIYCGVAAPAYTDVESYIQLYIAEFRKYGSQESESLYKRLPPRKIDCSLSAIIYDYQGSVHNTFERVAYIQVPDAVCSITFSAKNKEDFQKYADAIYDVIDSFQDTAGRP